MDTFIEPYRQLIKAQWSQLTAQDQLAINVLSVVVGVAFVYLFVWQPVQKAHQQAEQRLGVSTEKWTWLNAQLPALAAQENTGIQAHALALKSKNSLSQYLQKKLKQHNLYRSMDGIQLKSKTVTVNFESVNAPRLFRWLSQMEREGLVAKVLKIDPLSVGMVSAKTTFEVQK